MLPPQLQADDMKRFYFHFLARTLLPDESGGRFADADSALRHARIMAAELAKSGTLEDCMIVVADDDSTLFEVPLMPWQH